MSFVRNEMPRSPERVLVHTERQVMKRTIAGFLLGFGVGIGTLLLILFPSKVFFGLGWVVTLSFLSVIAGSLVFFWASRATNESFFARKTR